MHMVPMSQPVYEQVATLHRAMGVYPPPPPERSMVLVDDAGVLVGSVCLYEARPFLLCEYFILNPEKPLRLRHHATKVLIEAVLGYAASNALAPVAPASSRGLATMLRRYGFSKSPATLYAAAIPSLPIADPVPKTSDTVQISKSPRRADAPKEIRKEKGRDEGKKSVPKKKGKRKRPSARRK